MVYLMPSFNLAIKRAFKDYDIFNIFEMHLMPLDSQYSRKCVNLKAAHFYYLDTILIYTEFIRVNIFLHSYQ